MEEQEWGEGRAHRGGGCQPEAAGFQEHTGGQWLWFRVLGCLRHLCGLSETSFAQTLLRQSHDFGSALWTPLGVRPEKGP